MYLSGVDDESSRRGRSVTKRGVDWAPGGRGARRQVRCRRPDAVDMPFHGADIQPVTHMRPIHAACDMYNMWIHYNFSMTQICTTYRSSIYASKDDYLARHPSRDHPQKQGADSVVISEPSLQLTSDGLVQSSVEGSFGFCDTCKKPAARCSIWYVAHIFLGA